MFITWIFFNVTILFQWHYSWSNSSKTLVTLCMLRCKVTLFLVLTRTHTQAKERAPKDIFFIIAHGRTDLAHWPNQTAFPLSRRIFFCYNHNSNGHVDLKVDHMGIKGSHRAEPHWNVCPQIMSSKSTKLQTDSSRKVRRGEIHGWRVLFLKRPWLTCRRNKIQSPTQPPWRLMNNKNRLGHNLMHKIKVG